MSLTAIILIVISAVMHAGWNLLSKKNRPSGPFFLLTNIVGVIGLSPFLVIYRNKLFDFPAPVWVLLGSTGFFMALYYCSLARAYQSGHMSVAYPLARSSPIIVVAVVTLILGRTEQVSIFCIFGIILVVGGCFLIPMKRFSDIRLKNYLNTTCCFALIAACGTAGYSMIDDEALRLLRNAFAHDMNPISIVLMFACLEAVCGTIWLGLFVVVKPSRVSSFIKVIQTQKKAAVLTGIGIYGTYILVLISMAFVKNVSYVVAFRQLSIPLGTGFGIMFLKEPVCSPKLAGVTIMFIGLMLVAVK